MAVHQVLKWQKRFSVLYAFGAWTLVCSAGYYQLRKRGQRQESPEPGNEELPAVLEPEPQIKEETPKRPFITGKVIFKENFVPYSTRIYNFVKSILDDAPQK